MTAVIELDGVGKRYWQLQEQAMLLKSLIPGRGTKKVERWALRDINFSVNAGETVGILGHNGAGKTTLLRMLAGVSRPSEGRIRIAGRIAPLISVGVGFHQEMSGRENVLVNGMLLGLSRRQIDARFDEIVAFAELTEFIDTPVKFYSSGMFMRLGFSVAVHVDPEVMLVDEVLAVGDVAFQLKCFDRMRHLQSQGTTILFVSHSMHAIRLLCPRAVLIRKGRLEFDGSAEAAIARHHELLSVDPRDLTEVAEVTTSDERSNGSVSITSRLLESADGPTHHPAPGDLVRYRVGLRFNRPVDSPHFVFHVTSEQGIPCYSMQTRIGQDWRRFAAGDETEIDVSFHARLGGGTYRLTVTVADRFGRDVLLNDPTGVVMYLAPRLGSGGFADLEADISASDTDLTQHAPLLIASRGEPPEMLPR
jgi:ABC-type polysaccharide/polyol phosphate transport system ATPase subunit